MVTRAFAVGHRVLNGAAAPSQIKLAAAQGKGLAEGHQGLKSEPNLDSTRQSTDCSQSIVPPPLLLLLSFPSALFFRLDPSQCLQLYESSASPPALV